jgi:hypothetical protein
LLAAGFGEYEKFGAGEASKGKHAASATCFTSPQPAKHRLIAQVQRKIKKPPRRTAFVAR